LTRVSISPPWVSGNSSVDRPPISQQAVHLDHVDAAIAHLLHEVEVVALGVVDPHDVVEQQGVAVGGRESLMGAARCAHHDLAQLTDLGVDAKGRGRRGRCLCHETLRCQMVM
jgi:hypothetical protein